MNQVLFVGEENNLKLTVSLKKINGEILKLCNNVSFCKVLAYYILYYILYILLYNSVRNICKNVLLLKKKTDLKNLIFIYIFSY